MCLATKVRGLVGCCPALLYLVFLAASLSGLGAACTQGLVVTTPTSSPVITATPEAVPLSSVAIIGGHVFFLEIADTPEEHARGLMGRASLPRDSAMLFIFDREDEWALWMKNTLIPLDGVWVNGQGEIVDMQTMYPEPGKSDAELTVYRPRAPARYILEMNAGLARTYQFTIGMPVVLRLGAGSQPNLP